MMTQQKIILDCDLMKYRNTGLYYYCLNLGKHLLQLAENDHMNQLLFYGRKEDVDVFGEKNIITEKKKNFFEKNFKSLAKAREQKLFNSVKLKPQVWHAPFQSGRILPPPGAGIKILLTIHDLNAQHETTFTKEQKATSLKHTQNLINRSDALVCISEYCKSDVLKFLDVKNKPIHVIHNGTNKMAEAPVNPVAYKPSKPFLFSVGYINRKKNFHVLVPLLKRNPELELVIAGKADEADYLRVMEKTAELLGAKERFHFVGQVCDEDKAWYMKNCEAFMFPSIAEGFGLPVTEAMHFGKPLFLANKTSLPEIGGDAAFYFEDFETDHMQDVFVNGIKKFKEEQMQARVMQRGREFDWQKAAKEYMKVYRLLMGA